MPKHIIEFNLPDETEELETTMKAGAYRSALWDFDQHLRSKAKHGQGKEAEEAQKIRDLLHEFLNDNGIEL